MNRASRGPALAAIALAGAASAAIGCAAGWHVNRGKPHAVERPGSFVALLAGAPITVYAPAACRHCEAVRRDLDRAGASYAWKLLRDAPRIAPLMSRLEIEHVPVIVTSTYVYAGWDPTLVERILQRDPRR